MTLCYPNSNLETADILGNIRSYLSDQCKALLIFINIIIDNCDELCYSESSRIGGNWNYELQITEINTL